ncbi:MULTISPECIES: TrmO family methyltransferase [unclassified Fusibacter]|uniref:TrmO family methyltransferase domain-containing protein n=1 Tax=unclassified Fusibacter TaxID=2624464 RepID=UPI0010109BAF|nr:MULTISPECIES: TrmO family methyltransferase [unclassified Fusibacter]MCK8060731.1 TrmO family methyltransferase [Fusibacter sp. A2]NPE23026.1 hypothetical protein [Fusibacter sp. A1]RXV59700.1 hypothetical protein DWB64_14380 [Fusibacter sp. A1]
MRVLKGIIDNRIILEGIDAHDDTAVLDIKPYLPCSDRVLKVHTADWATNWPQSLEESSTFDWSKVFDSAML